MGQSTTFYRNSIQIDQTNSIAADMTLSVKLIISKIVIPIYFYLNYRQSRILFILLKV